MRHLRRWLFNLLALVSLAVCVLLVTAWVLQTSGADIWTLTRTIPPSAKYQGQFTFDRADTWQATFSRGEVWFDKFTVWNNDPAVQNHLTPVATKFRHEVNLPD